MADTTSEGGPDTPQLASAALADVKSVDDELVDDDELLVEDVSIDGMCGVY